MPTDTAGPERSFCSCFHCSHTWSTWSGLILQQVQDANCLMRDKPDPRCSLWGERLCVFPKHGKSSCTPLWLRRELSGLLKREELSNENTSVTSIGLFCRPDQIEDLQTSVWSVSKQDLKIFFFFNFSCLTANSDYPLQIQRFKESSGRTEPTENEEYYMQNLAGIYI